MLSDHSCGLFEEVLSLDSLSFGTLLRKGPCELWQAIICHHFSSFFADKFDLTGVLFNIFNMFGIFSRERERAFIEVFSSANMNKLIQVVLLPLDPSDRFKLAQAASSYARAYARPVPFSCRSLAWLK
jgi:hypothetical protein